MRYKRRTETIRRAHAMKTLPLVAALVVTLLLPLGARADADADADAFQRSVDLESEARYGEALRAMDAIEGATRDSYLFHLRRGWLTYLEGAYAESIAAYEAAAAKAPKAVEPRLAVLLPQMAARRWLDAEKAARAALALDADNYLAESRLAYVLYNLARYSEAAAAYAAVLALYPGDVEMRTGYAWSLLKLNQSADARREFQAVLAVAPRHASAQKGLNLCP